MVAGVKGGTRLLGWSTRKVEILIICKITLLPFRTGREEWRWYGCIQLGLLFFMVPILQVSAMGKA